MRNALSRVAFASILFLAHGAGAVPADIFIVVDTSASMKAPSGGPPGETRLDVAKRIASQIATAAGQKNRVGLVRFAQLDTVVKGGAGPMVAHAEDPRACDHGSNLIEAPQPGSAAVLRWLDGVDEPGNPELVAIGDSPLYATLEVTYEFIRQRRVLDVRNCVNTFLVFLTDGGDTCARRDMQGAAVNLVGQGRAEDIHGLVLSFDPSADSPKVLAQLGQDPVAAHVYGPAEAANLVAAVGAIDGRLAPEACLLSQQLALGQNDAGITPCPVVPTPDAGVTKNSGKGCGCEIGGSEARDGAGTGGLGLLLGFGVAGALLRRRARLALTAIALMAFGLGGCGRGAGTGSKDGATAGCPDAGVPLVEPNDVLTRELARSKLVIDAADGIRTDLLRPLLDPTQTFAKVTGDPIAGCLALARAIAFEPYAGAQRDAAGCLSAQRCNAIDHALLFKACLASKGMASDLYGCDMPADVRTMLLAATAAPTPVPDLKAVDARIQEAMAQVQAVDPDTAEAVARYSPAIAAFELDDLTKSLTADVDKLLPLARAVSADESATAAMDRLNDGLTNHYYVTVGKASFDPTLDQSHVGAGTECTGDTIVDPDAAGEGTHMTVTISVQNADVIDQQTVLTALVPFATLTFPVHKYATQTLSVAITGTEQGTIPAGIPTPAAKGCLHAFIKVGDQTVTGTPFAIADEDAPDCPGSGSGKTPGRHLARLILDVTTTDANGQTHTARRVLNDRYGYASTTQSAFLSGPSYSNRLARTMLPERVDLPLIPGLPCRAAIYDAILADLVARRDDIAARFARQLGVPTAPVGDGVPANGRAWLPATVLALFATQAPSLLGTGQSLLITRPWLTGVVSRRGFTTAGKGLTIAPQTIFDIMDTPIVVSGGTPDARLRTSLAMGALLTEAERQAIAVFFATHAVINAGAMFRDQTAGTGWLPIAQANLTLLPLSVQAAAQDRQDEGYALVVSPGPVPFGGDNFVAWWRIDPQGVALGEVRNEGTFFGEAAPVQFIADVDKCLYATASDALAGQATPDNDCCIARAAIAYELTAFSDAALAELPAGGNLAGIASFAGGGTWLEETSLFWTGVIGQGGLEISKMILLNLITNAAGSLIGCGT